MRRVINEEEKKLLDKYAKTSLTMMIPLRVGFSFTAFAISCVAGAILGSIIAFGVIGMNNDWSMPAFFLIMLVVTALFTWLTSVIGTKRIRNRLFRVGKTKINGATCISEADSQVFPHPEFVYTEDDLLDQDGNPYKIVLPELFAFPRKGERFIVVENDGVTFLLECNAHLKCLIPETPPQNTDEAKAVIGHSNQITFATEDVPDGNARINRFFSVYTSTNTVKRSWAILGTAFFGFMGWAFLVFLVFGIFFSHVDEHGRYFMFGIPMIFIMTGLSILVCIKYFQVRNKEKYKNFTKIEKVVLVSSSVSFVVPHARDFMVCEKGPDGEMMQRAYIGVDGFDASDAASMKPGQIIYKYSYGEKGIFFGTK